ncbi:hypothetical protein [uncultured Sphingobacterium sp.]|uniref:hypothetical protein n=1 Tax=uncultured Sphingobacterium sp. TaxID=182688 RepID=UPI0025F774AE|nr:hypothetical protein [uncultured Sphingobacterium sp.]
MNNKITWKELKALNDIYHLKKSSASIQQHPYIHYLIHDKGILDLKETNNKVILSTEVFENYYRREYLIQYEEAKTFLINQGIETSARKSFTLEDVKALMLIAENKKEINENPTNIEDFSNEFFDISKYLKNKASLRDAVFKILEIMHFPLDRKENQWRLVVDNPKPKAIVLCENKSFLKRPWIAKNTGVKLWYVGGNNIVILDQIDEIELAKPIYYSCDWDLAGLEIYHRIKQKLKKLGANITLLYPEPQKKISTYIEYHYSHWNLKKNFSGLPIESFSKQELLLIHELIKGELWIEEESFDLELMINKVVKS